MNDVDLPEYIRKRVAVRVDDCWDWTGARNPRGYGQFTSGGQTISAHRTVFELLRGPIPAGLEIDHLCRNRSCVNPDHLEPVTHRENLMRSTGPAAINALKTHCDGGHEFTPKNTYTHRGSRLCRACNRAAAKRYRDRRRGGAVS